MVTQLASSRAWSTELIAELDAIDQNAKLLTAELSSKQLNWQPAPDTWSIGQCLEHLCIFNEMYLPRISAALVDKPVLGVQQITLGWFARWFIGNFVEPSPVSKRASAPKKIKPSSLVEASVLDRLLRTNQDARELILHAQRYNVNRIRFVNPIVPIIRFTVGAGLRITCGHERRHLLQAQRVKQSPTFPY